MDSTLRCNDLKCRAQCPDQAIVTTCSHIFCIPCANNLGLANPINGQRLCPACQSPLNNPDDAVMALLNPAEDYKTSILSGLNPTIIMECAGRGLAFWAYQMVQEITYQEFLAKSLTERYSALSGELQNATAKEKEANAKLQNQLNVARAENQSLVERCRQLEQSYKEKAKAANQQKALYDKLKQQQLAGTVQYAADDDADAILQHASQQPQQHHSNSQRHMVQQQTHGRGGSNGSGSSEERRQQRVTSWPTGGAAGGAYQQAHDYGGGHNYRTTTSQSAPIAPPTANRQRLPQPIPRNLPQPAFGSYNSTLLGGGARGAGMSREPHRTETPLHGGYSRSHQQGLGGSPSGGFGMSAGMRMGRPSGGGVPLSRGMGHSRPGGYSQMGLR